MSKDGEMICKEKETELERMVAKMTEMQYEYAKELFSLINQATSMGEERVLTYLYNVQDNALPGQLTEELQLSTGRIANILKQLEKKEYIERQRGDQDKRSVIVSLTEKGRQFAAQKYQENVQSHRMMIELLGEEDTKEFLRIFEKVFEILRTTLDGRP